MWVCACRLDELLGLPPRWMAGLNTFATTGNRCEDGWKGGRTGKGSQR